MAERARTESEDLTAEPASGGNFIRQIVAADVAAGKRGGAVITRFPPEPNGRLHIGHAKAICLDFGIAREFGGRCHLRFDDTNPATEDVSYVHAIQEDVRWLGFDWGKHLYYASDYFGRLYDCAVELIRRDKAFVCDLSSEEIAARRGTLTEPGMPSPYRARSIEENLDLFARMKAGEFEPGSRVLRARIDMASSNLTLRDPILYRIHRAPHHRTGTTWCVYPMYDFAHCLSDSFEAITHSLCSLEFVDHRALYDWVLDALGADPHPQQIEFARLNLSYTVMSKRLLKRLVEEGHVAGWDDPRMPTLCGMRRRGYTPAAIRNFCEDIGVAKRENTIELAKLEAAVRDDLNRTASRAMGVLRPLRVVIENYPEGLVEEFELPNHPQDPSRGTRRVPFARELWIEREDFEEVPPPKFFRLSPGREVRLRGAYLVTCTRVVKDAAGRVVELRCSYDPATRGGEAPGGRKVKGTLHWVSAQHAVRAEVRLYETLFSVPDPNDVPEGGDFTEALRPDSLERLTDCWLERALADAEPGQSWQLERLGYFCADPDSKPGAIVLSRTVGLRDTWGKLQQREG
jgi:glutaminyl-tRNA synthetase